MKESYIPGPDVVPNFAPDFGDLDDEQLAAIGRVAIAFGHVEFLTSELIGHLAEDDEMRVVTDAISRQLDWIREASEERIADDDLTRSINEWMPRVRIAARRRNSVLHGMWSVDPEETDKLANISAKTRGGFTVGELQELAVTIAKLADDTVELSDDVGDYFIFKSLETED